ncbi:MAG: DUF1295 domain-containing protein, partial [Planctomycetaceae bacterium]|nr:DUF1295 domain-containing protein [Planctomycetaceae bacterium]
MTEIVMNNAVLIGGMMALVWLVSIPLRDVSIIDLVWGLGFVLVAWKTAWLFNDWSFAAPSRPLLLGMTTLWGLRLTSHLAMRNIGHGEDKRYAAMRCARPQTFWWQSLLLVFGLQAGVMWLISLPLQFGIAQPTPGWHWQHVLGLLFWAMGLFFEAVGDWQLMRFKQNPANRGQVL